MKNNGTQTIETRRLLLRKLNISDAQQMFDNWASDDEVTKYMRWKSHKDIETTKAVINMWLKEYEKDDVYRWVIVLKETGELAGAIDVVNFNKEEKAAYAGYCLSKKHWNKGIMTEALKNVIGYLFKEDGIEKVKSWHHIDNPASGKVMEKSGMKFTETKKDGDVDNNGNPCDISVYEICK